MVAGDTLSDIAQHYGMSQQQLSELNALDDPRIRVGQILAVQGTREGVIDVIEYIVAIGDTLTSIAERHAVKIANIRNTNGEAISSDLIHPGDTLTILVEPDTQG